MSLLRWLRGARLVVAAVFFCGLVWLAAGAGHVEGGGFPAALAHVQFVPSLLLGLAGGGFAVALGWGLVSLLAGRVYCGTVCPLGFFQDGVWALRRRLFPKRLPFVRGRALPRALWLAAIAAACLSGGWLALGLLDPYSLLSRAVAGSLHPAADALAALPARWAEGVRAFPTWSISAPGWAGLALLGLVAAGAAWRGRLFCNTLCPVGALLGLLAHASRWKLRIEKSLCVKCGECLRACPAQCLDLRAGSVDFSRCVLCLECVASCERNGIRMDHAPLPPRPARTSGLMASAPGRRAFLAALAGGAAFCLAPAAAARQHKRAGRGCEGCNGCEQTQPAPILPPGARSMEAFLRNCTACGLCAARCPTGALQPSLLELGWKGLLRPRLDPSAGFCNAGCNLCTTLCPTGALSPLPLAIKQRTRLGLAVFQKCRCVIHKQGTDCGACAEHCPTGALTMVKNRHGVALPHVDENLCTGCGACQHACPVRPSPAIVVSGVYPRLLLPQRSRQAPLPSREIPDFPF